MYIPFGDGWFLGPVLGHPLQYILDTPLVPSRFMIRGFSPPIGHVYAGLGLLRVLWRRAGHYACPARNSHAPSAVCQVRILPTLLQSAPPTPTPTFTVSELFQTSAVEGGSPFSRFMPPHVGCCILVVRVRPVTCWVLPLGVRSPWWLVSHFI